MIEVDFHELKSNIANYKEQISIIEEEKVKLEEEKSVLFEKLEKENEKWHSVRHSEDEESAVYKLQERIRDEVAEEERKKEDEIKEKNTQIESIKEKAQKEIQKNKDTLTKNKEELAKEALLIQDKKKNLVKEKEYFEDLIKKDENNPLVRKDDPIIENRRKRVSDLQKEIEDIETQLPDFIKQIEEIDNKLEFMNFDKIQDLKTDKEIEEERARQEEEEAKRRQEAEEEAKRRQEEEEAKRKQEAEEEAKRRQEEEEAKRRQEAEEEAKRRQEAEEEAKRRQEEEEAKRRQEAEEAKRRQEISEILQDMKQETKRQQAEEAKRRQEAEEAKRRQEEEEAKKRKKEEISIEINEKLGIVYTSTIIDGEEYSTGFNISESLEDKKSKFERLNIKQICQDITDKKSEARRLYKKINPLIIQAIEHNPDLIKGYISAINNEEELPIELIHDIGGINIFKKLELRKYTKAEEKSGALIKGKIFNRNRALKKGKNNIEVEEISLIEKLERSDLSEEEKAHIQDYAALNGECLARKKFAEQLDVYNGEGNIEKQAAKSASKKENNGTKEQLGRY